MKNDIDIVEKLDISFSLKSAIYCLIASTKNEHPELFLEQAKAFIDYNIQKSLTTEKMTDTKPVDITVKSSVDKEISELADKIFGKTPKKPSVSENKEKAIAMFYSGISKDEIANKLGLSISTVRKYIKQDLDQTNVCGWG